MDQKKGILNVSVSITFKVIIFIVAILHRRFLIECVGNEINGLNSLYSSLLNVLSVAELGIGSAIVYCMYRPIVEKNHEQVVALYQLFKKVYHVVGAMIFAIGMVCVPLLPYLAKDYVAIDINIYLPFVIILLNACLTYMYTTKLALIDAYKNNYITTTLNSCNVIISHILQTVILVCTRSYFWCVFSLIPITVLHWIVTEILCRRMHGDILKAGTQKLDAGLKAQVLKNVKAMFAHRLGSVLVYSADSVIISVFIGVVLLGKYTNYTTIITNMTTMIALFFSPLVSIVGHMYVTEKERTIKYYHFFYAFNVSLGMIFYMGYYAVADSLVSILFGEGLEMAKQVLLVITVNYFIQFIRQANHLFREATGTFYQDRWKPFAEGILNVILSIAAVLAFSKWFGEEIGLVGVIVATIVTNLTLCHLIEPYVIYKYAFGVSVKKQWIKNYLYIALFILSLLVLDRCLVSMENRWLELLVNGCISVAFSVIPVLVIVLSNKDFRYYLKAFRQKILGK